MSKLEKLNKLTEGALDRIKFDRKPDSFSSVQGKVKYSDRDMGDLPRHTAKEVWGEEKDKTILKDFKKEMPQYFIVSYDESDFLINTEGFKYARYAINLDMDT